MVYILIIIFLSSIRSIETCYGCYKTESFHLFKGLRETLFPFDWYFRIIFGILSELILSSCLHTPESEKVAVRVLCAVPSRRT
jgi:hypothetical protein